MIKTPTTQQIEDAAFLVKQKWAALFSEPGTGKTLTAITARKALPANLRTLVICPKIALKQWQDELAEQGIDATVMRASKDFRDLEACTTVITTWTLMTTNRQKLENWYPEIIIADESHACIDYSSNRTTQFYGKNGDGMGLATSSEWVWALTGTPIVRFADDLWPMLVTLFPGLLTRLVGSKRRAAFCEKFVQYRLQPTGRGRSVQVPCAGMNEDLLFETIYDGKIAVRRTLAEVDENLPAMRERDIEIDLVDFDETLLKGHTIESLKKDTEEVKSIRRAFGRSKVAGALEYLETIKEPVLVLTWHQDVTDALAAGVEGNRVIDGRTSQAQRDAAVAAFSEGRASRLIGQIGAVGTALDGLQHACRRVVFVERIGSPALMEQAIARVQRRGQRDNVQVDYLRAHHVLETVTDQTLEAKEDTQRRAIG